MFKNKKGGLALSKRSASNGFTLTPKNFGVTLRSKGGFTLIEILVVIGIIAILAAIVLIAISPARQFALARQNQRVANVNTILNAIGQHIAENQGDLPSELAIPYLEAEVNADLCTDLVPEFVSAIPTDPESDSEGASIDCSGLGAGDVEYYVEVDGDGHVTVCAPEAANEDALDSPVEICVGR